MRGQFVTITLQGDYGKPRPALIIQSDIFSDIPSVTIVPLTSELRNAPLLRFTVKPSTENGLRKISQLMIDKINTVPREKIGSIIGKLGQSELIQIDRLIAVFLDLA